MSTRWLPHDIGTWGFIATVVALILALPLGIIGTLVAPKVQLWWFLRSVKGKAGKLVALVEYRQKIEKEPLFSPTEALIFRQHFALMIAVHIVAYLVILAVTMIPKWHLHMTFREELHNSIPLVPFVLLLGVSMGYFGTSVLNRLQRSTPEGRAKVNEQIVELIEELQRTPPKESRQPLEP